MIAEDRAWWIRRLDKEFKDQQEAQKRQSSSIPKPSMPRGTRR